MCRGCPSGRAFRVGAKVLRVRDTVYIKETDGAERIKLQKRLPRARDTMAIEILDEYQITRDGIPVANISKRWVRVRER